MTNLLARSLSRDISTIEDYINAFGFSHNGQRYPLIPYIQQTLTGDRAERPGQDIIAFARRMYVNNGIVFACMSVRALIFSSVRIIFQRLEDGRPSKLFGRQSLQLFEQPWPGGTTQALLAHMLQDVDLAGNSYWARSNGQLIRLRADWVQLVMTPRANGLGYEVFRYLYWEGGVGVRPEPVILRPGEVVHFIQTPDPEEPYKGMSWLRTVFSEVANDELMERHKTRVFENGATPNMVIKFPPNADEDAFEEFVTKFRSRHEGSDNAGKTLFLSDGADVEVVGKDFRQLDFKSVQGHAETRIAAAAGIPPVIVGFSEGLQGSSLNTGNYSAARRRLADGTMHPLWQSAVGALSRLVPAETGVRLWYDTRDVPFVREDERDVAEIQQKRAVTIRQLMDAGFTHESVVQAVEADDFSLLKHSGLFSVQLQPPGTTDPSNGASETEPTGETTDEPQ